MTWAAVGVLLAALGAVSFWIARALDVVRDELRELRGDVVGLVEAFRHQVGRRS